MTDGGTSRGVFNCRSSRDATSSENVVGIFLFPRGRKRAAYSRRSEAKVEFSLIDVVLIRLLINESEINNDSRTDVVARISNDLTTDSGSYVGAH